MTDQLVSRVIYDKMKSSQPRVLAIISAMYNLRTGPTDRTNGLVIIRNEVTFLYVLLECFKWISMYFKANNAINAYNIDSL